MENDMSYEQMARIVDERKIERAKDYAEQSRKQLMKVADTKVRTTFIGALSEFEKNFGFLWGFKPELWTDEQRDIAQKLTEAGVDETFFRQLWDLARTAVLNNGNNQMRALATEISQYSMTWDRFRMQMPVKQPGTIGG